MRRLRLPAKFAALAVLIFVNSTLVWGQSDSIYRLQPGTKIRLKLDVEINSRISSVNDTFIALVAKPVMVRETVVIPADTIIEGRVTRVSRAAGGNQNGKIDVVFETLKMGNSTRRIEGMAVKPFKAESSTTISVLSILGGAVAGALVGAANSPKGAMIGGGVGAGIGSGIAFLRKGKDLRIRKGEEFEIELKKEVVLPVLDY